MYKILFLIIMIFLSTQTRAQTYFHSQYPSVWSRSEAYTLEVAEAMPEDKFNYRPDTSSMSFQEQMIHIAQNLAFLSSKITGIHPDLFKVEGRRAFNKKEVLEILRNSLEHVAQLIRNIDDSTLHENLTFGGEEMTKENIFYLMRDHMAHHRGQALLHLRMNGINAPRYRGW